MKRCSRSTDEKRRVLFGVTLDRPSTIPAVFGAIPPDLADADGWTIAHHAIHRGPLVLAAVLEHGASADAVTDGGETIATMAAGLGKAAHLAIALRHGCPIVSPRPHAASCPDAASIAISGRHGACLRLLVDHGAIPPTLDDHDEEAWIRRWGAAEGRAGHARRAAFAACCLDGPVPVLRRKADVAWATTVAAARPDAPWMLRLLAACR